VILHRASRETATDHSLVSGARFVCRREYVEFVKVSEIYREVLKVSLPIPPNRGADERSHWADVAAIAVACGVFALNAYAFRLRDNVKRQAAFRQRSRIMYPSTPKLFGETRLERIAAITSTWDNAPYRPQALTKVAEHRDAPSSRSFVDAYSLASHPRPYEFVVFSVEPHRRLGAVFATNRPILPASNPPKFRPRPPHLPACDHAQAHNQSFVMYGKSDR
jgi:hypothetical protein